MTEVGVEATLEEYRLWLKPIFLERATTEVIFLPDERSNIVLGRGAL